MEKSPSASGVSRQPAALGLRPWLRHFIRGARAALPRLSSWAIPSTTRTGRSLQPRVIGSRGLMTVTICLEDVTSQASVHALRGRTCYIQPPVPSSDLPSTQLGVERGLGMAHCLSLCPCHVVWSPLPHLLISLPVCLSLSVSPSTSRLLPHSPRALLGVRKAPFRPAPLLNAILSFATCVSPPTAISTQSGPGSRAASSVKPTLITSPSPPPQLRAHSLRVPGVLSLSP